MHRSKERDGLIDADDRSRTSRPSFLFAGKLNFGSTTLTKVARALRGNKLLARDLSTDRLKYSTSQNGITLRFIRESGGVPDEVTIFKLARKGGFRVYTLFGSENTSLLSPYCKLLCRYYGVRDVCPSGLGFVFNRLCQEYVRSKHCAVRILEALNKLAPKRNLAVLARLTNIEAEEVWCDEIRGEIRQINAMLARKR